MARRPAVLDASAVLAVVRREPGFEQIERYLWDGVIGVFNALEVACVLRREGVDAAAAAAIQERLTPRVLAFEVDQIPVAAEIYAATRAAGLSQGDCACLALGRRLGRPVVTRDRAWAAVDLGVEVLLVKE